MLAVRQAQDRLGRLEQAITAAVPDWSLAPVVTADGHARHRPDLDVILCIAKYFVIQSK